jgi:hypothetical protein
MHGSRNARQGWVGGLLLALQLAANVILPLAHAGERLADPADHVEAPGAPHPERDDTACTFCRAADSRFIAVTRQVPAASAAGSAGRQSAADCTFRQARPLFVAAAPRAPPLA